MPRLGMIPRTKSIKGTKIRRDFKFQKRFFIILVPILIIVLIYLSNNLLKPTLFKMTESRAKSIGLSLTNKVVNKYIKDMQDKQIIKVEKDKDGRLTGLDTNVFELNKIAVDIAGDVQKELSKVENGKINIPIGSIVFPNTMFAAMGPNIPVEIVPMGNVKTEFKTDFVAAGINQTHHRILIEVTTNMNIIAPFVAKSSTVSNTILVSDTVLMGEVPATYYNLQGLTPQETTPLMESPK